MHWIRKANHVLIIFEKALVILIFFALVSLIFLNILSRNFFHLSFQKILEIAPALVLWLALIGSTLALNEGRHIKLELLLRFTPEKLRRVANILTNGFGLVVMGILLWASFGFVKNEVEIFGNLGWFSVVFPLFFTIAFFRYVLRMTRKL
jgi:TRAP-type transport system small permease protein